MKLMKNLAIYTLFTAIFAPQAQAMNILPKAASQVAIIAAKSPSVRTALTQVSKAGTQEFSGLVPQAERQFMTSTQPGAKFTAIPAKPNTGAALARPGSFSQGNSMASMPRSFNTSAVQSSNIYQWFKTLIVGQPSKDIISPVNTPVQNKPVLKQTLSLKSFLERLGDYSEYESILKKMKKDPEFKAELLQLIVKDFMQIIEHGLYGRKIIVELMQRNAGAQQTFMILVNQHFVELADKHYGPAIIKELMQCDSGAQQTFMNVVRQNIVELAGKYGAPEIINEMMQHDPGAQQTFINMVSQNFVKIANKYYGPAIIKELMQRNAGAQQTFMNLVNQHFVELTGQGYGLAIIKEMMQRDPGAQQTFINAVSKNFLNIAGKYYGPSIIKELMQRDAGAQQTFINLVSQNFKEIANQYNGMKMTSEMIQCYPEARQTFRNVIVQDFVHFSDEYVGSTIIQDMIQYDEGARQVFMNLMHQNFMKFANTWGAADIVHKMMQYDAGAGQIFINLINQNFVELVDKYHGPKLIKEMMQHDAGAQELFVREIVQKSAQIIQTLNGRSFIKDVVIMQDKAIQKLFEQEVKRFCSKGISQDEDLANIRSFVEHFPNIRSLFTDYVAQNLATVCDKEPIIVAILMENPETKEMLRQKASEIAKHGKDSKNLWIKALNEQDPTITQKYLIHTSKDMHGEAQTDLKDIKVRNFVDEVIEIEKVWQPNYYTFEHGKRWEYKLPEMVYRHFYGLANNVNVPKDFMFTHTKPHIYSPKLKAEEFKQEKILCERVINEPANIPGEVRNRRLFMNTGLLGNINSWGSSSFYYVLKNYNQADARVSMKTIFEQFGLQELYKKHEAQCEALEKEARVLSKWGQLLTIGIPKTKISEIVTYITFGGQEKHKIKVGNEETHDTKRILDARLMDPTLANNDINWVAAMTDNALLDPKSGAKIKAVERPIDPVAFAAWEMKFKEFMQSISAEAQEIMDAHQKAAIEKDKQG